jgi:hypothetical protein
VIWVVVMTGWPHNMQARRVRFDFVVAM